MNCGGSLFICAAVTLSTSCSLTFRSKCHLDLASLRHPFSPSEGILHQSTVVPWKRSDHVRFNTLGEEF